MDAKTLAAAMPGLTLARAETWASPIAAAMLEYGILGNAACAAFLGQVGHESGSLVYVKEIWGPTAVQLRYEGRADLGNVQPGDGIRFRGRGLIQVTGRANYAACGAALGLDLLTHPELLEQPLPAARSAGWFWKMKGLNRFVNDDLTLTKRVNGGTNGLADRVARTAQARRVLGV